MDSLDCVDIQPFSSSVSPTFTVPDSPLDIFKHFFADDLVEHIVEESNRYAREAMGDEKYTTWTKITAGDIQALLGSVSSWGLFICLLFMITGHFLPTTCLFTPQL